MTKEQSERPAYFDLAGTLALYCPIFDMPGVYTTPPDAVKFINGVIEVLRTDGGPAAYANVILPEVEKLKNGITNRIPDVYIYALIKWAMSHGYCSLSQHSRLLIYLAIPERHSPSTYMSGWGSHRMPQDQTEFILYYAAHTILRADMSIPKLRNDVQRYTSFRMSPQPILAVALARALSAVLALRTRIVKLFGLYHEFCGDAGKEPLVRSVLDKLDCAANDISGIFTMLQASFEAYRVSLPEDAESIPEEEKVWNSV